MLLFLSCFIFSFSTRIFHLFRLDRVLLLCRMIALSYKMVSEANKLERRMFVYRRVIFRMEAQQTMSTLTGICTWCIFGQGIECANCSCVYGRRGYCNALTTTTYKMILAERFISVTRPAVGM